MGDIYMKRNGKKSRARARARVDMWEQYCFGLRVCVSMCVCARMIHTYHYSFPIIVKPLRSECCCVYGNYDVMRWQLH